MKKYLTINHAKKIYANTQYNRGICYEIGEGVPKDIQKAKECYELAAREKIDEAAYRIGLLSLQGVSSEKLEQARDNALAWFRKAKLWGHKDAKNQIMIIEATRYMYGVSPSLTPAFSQKAISNLGPKKLIKHAVPKISIIPPPEGERNKTSYTVRF